MTKDDLRTILSECILECLTDMVPNALQGPMSSLPETAGIELAVAVTGLRKSTIYGWVSRKEIPHFKKGKRLYFRRTELEAWISSGRVSTTADILAKVDSMVFGKGRHKNRK